MRRAGRPAPLSDDIRAARKHAGLTQTAAARTVHVGLRTWQDWESGSRRMHPGLWELFRIKVCVLPGDVREANADAGCD